MSTASHDLMLLGLVFLLMGVVSYLMSYTLDPLGLAIAGVVMLVIAVKIHVIKHVLVNDEPL